MEFNRRGAARSAERMFQTDVTETELKREIHDLVDTLDAKQLRKLSKLLKDFHAAQTAETKKTPHRLKAIFEQRPKWKDRSDKKETPLAFIARVYPDREQLGLSQADLRSDDADPALYMALHNWLRGPKNGAKRTIPDEFNLPTKSAQLDKLLADAELDPARPDARLHSVAWMRAVRRFKPR